MATPIGNLSDISRRACQVLQDVDFIAAEDTRVTVKLLAHLDIKNELVSYHKHNMKSSGKVILSRILNGESCALATDAGTPGISDPGEDLVRLCICSDVPVVAIPGPCAAVAALSVSGFCADRFTFEGFLPADKKKRGARLCELKNDNRTLVFYEAPHKLLRTLRDMQDTLGDRNISISREITKIYEETLRFSLSKAISHFEATAPRGEFVLVVEGAASDKAAIAAASIGSLDAAKAMAVSLIDNGLSVRDAVKKAALETGCSKNELYKAVQLQAAQPLDV